jgi:hypothetical protein
MAAEDQLILKADFDVNLDLWKHEEGLRQQRNTVLLSVNAFLAIGVSAMISVGPPVEVAVGIGLGLSFFGLVSCWIWNMLQARHVLYADFRRKQLRELAAKLGYESWKNQWAGLRTNPPPEPVKFATIGDAFYPRAETRSAIVTESYLPKVVALLWILFAVGCLVVMVINL